MRKPLSSVGFLVLLVGLVGSISTPKAQAQKYLAPNYNHCARPFYDPQSYNWYSVQNTCSFAIKVVLVAFSGDHGPGALDLGPGRHDGTGETESEIRQHGGYDLYICPAGYTPVDANDEYIGAVNRANTQFRCMRE